MNYWLIILWKIDLYELSYLLMYNKLFLESTSIFIIMKIVEKLIWKIISKIQFKIDSESSCLYKKKKKILFLQSLSIKLIKNPISRNRLKTIVS